MRTTWTSKYKTRHRIPSFVAQLHDGSSISDTGLLGQPSIFFFYNHDGSETCTNEICNMRDHFSLLANLGYKVFGVSEDSVSKHQRFAIKLNLPFHLISDQHNVLAKTFDVYGPKLFMGKTTDAVHRTTFVIDANGLIEAIIHPVNSSMHAQQIIGILQTMQ